MIKLYSNGKVKKILISGDNGTILHDEISAMNEYLINENVPQSVIFADYADFDTYLSMDRANKIFGINDAIIVSQAYHLPRAVYIAKQRGINALGFTSYSRYGKKRYFVREWFASIKSFLDCTFNRKAKYYGKKINTDGKSNVKLD